MARVVYVCFSVQSSRPALAFARSGKGSQLALRDCCASGILALQVIRFHPSPSVMESHGRFLASFLHSSLLSQSIIKAALLNLSGRNFIDIVINISSPKIISSSTLKFLLLSLRVKCQVKPNLFILTHTRTQTLCGSLHSGKR